MSTYCKEFLAINHAIVEYSHILWEITLLTLVMTDNRSVTRFFQTKTIPPTIWNACDYVLQFKFHIMHVAGTQNTAAYFLYRDSTSTPKKESKLKIRNDITIRPIQVNIQSTDVADDEQLFSFQKKLSKLKKKSYCRKNKQDRMHAQSQ